MNVEDLARVAEECRHAQKEYYRTGSVSAMAEAQRLEVKLDRCLSHVWHNQKTLFEDSPTREARTDAV